jgi:hypothetical protein
MTLAGDIAQATGPCAYSHWDEITQHLLAISQPRVEELTEGYRVAGQVMEFAARLLPQIAPGAAAPIAYRPGADDPAIMRVAPDGLLKALIETVTAIGVGAGTLGVIVPDADLRQVSAVLDRAGIEFGEAVNGLSQPIEVLTPRAAKGLEFDDVVVLEPRAIAEDGPNGLRELYVALTRATQQLYVLHSRGLPAALTAGELSGPEVDVEPASLEDAEPGRPVAALGIGLTEAFAVARIVAPGSCRGLSHRLMAAALVLQHGSGDDEGVAALLLPPMSETAPPLRIGGRCDEIIAGCVEARRGEADPNAAAEASVRVLLADAIASIGAQDAVDGHETDYDHAKCRALIDAGRSLRPGGALLADELDRLLQRYT